MSTDEQLHFYIPGATIMSQYPKTSSGDSIKSKITGRISSRNQIFLKLVKAHQNDYKASRSRKLAIAFKRFIKSEQNYVRKSPVFVAEIKSKLLCLHEYNLEVAKGNKYPKSIQLYKLLILYVELECELLYRTTEPVPVQKEAEVEKRVLKVVHSILNDAIQKNDVPINTTRDICLKIILKVLVDVRRDIVEKNNVIDNAIVKIVDQIGCLDKVNEFRKKNSVIYLDEFFQEPEAMELRRKLTTSDYDSESFDSDDDEDFTNSSDEWDNGKPKYVKHLPLIPIKEEKTDLCVSPPSDSGGDDGNPNSNLPVGNNGCGVQLLEEGSKNGQAGAISRRSVCETGHEQTGAIVTIEILDDDDDYDYNQQNNNSITSSEWPAVVDIKVENDESASPNSVSGGDGEGGGFGTDNQLKIPNSDDLSNDFLNANDSCGNREQTEENEVVCSKEIIHEVDCHQIEEVEESNLLVLEEPSNDIYKPPLELPVENSKELVLTQDQGLVTETNIFENVSEDEAQGDHLNEELVNGEDDLQLQDMELEESPKTSQVFERCPNNQEEDQSLEEIVKELQQQLTDDGQAQEITQPAIVEKVVEPVEVSQLDLEKTADIYNELEKNTVRITVTNSVNDEETEMNTNPEKCLEDENVQEPVIIISENGESEGTDKSSVQPSIDETSKQIEEKSLNYESVVDSKLPEQELEPIPVHCSHEKTEDIVQEDQNPTILPQEIKDSPSITDSPHCDDIVSSAGNEESLLIKDVDLIALNEKTPRTRKSEGGMAIVKRKQGPTRISRRLVTNDFANNQKETEPLSIKRAMWPSKVVENEFTPNDFITLQSSSTSTPTNNVYAEKRVSESNAISEDSADSCENSLIIDEGKITDKSVVHPLYDEETIDDGLEFVSYDADCIIIPKLEADFHNIVRDQSEDTMIECVTEANSTKQTDHSIERLLNTSTTTSEVISPNDSGSSDPIENFVDKIRNNFENNIKQKLMESMNSTNEEEIPIDFTVKKDVTIPPLSTVEEDSIIGDTVVDECATNLKVDRVDENQEQPFKSKGALKSFDKGNHEIGKGTIKRPRQRSTSLNFEARKIAHHLDTDYLDLDPFPRKFVKPPDCESITVGGNCDVENEDEINPPVECSKESAQSIDERVISEEVVAVLVIADANIDPEISPKMENGISSERMENDSVEEQIISEQVSTEEAVEVDSATELFLDETEHVESAQMEVPVPEPTPVKVAGLSEMSANDSFDQPEYSSEVLPPLVEMMHQTVAEDVEIVTESVGASPCEINLDLPPVLIQQEPIQVVPKTLSTSDFDQPPQLERQMEAVKVPTSLDLSQSENVSDADISSYPFNSMPPIIVTSPVKEKPTTKPIERITRSRNASEKHTKTSLENTIKKVKERVQKSKSDSMSPSGNTAISEENVKVVDKNDGRVSRSKSYSSDESRSRSERSKKRDHRKSSRRSLDMDGKQIDSGSDRDKSKSLEKNIRVNHHQVDEHEDSKSKTVDSLENKKVNDSNRLPEKSKILEIKTKIEGKVNESESSRSKSNSDGSKSEAEKSVEKHRRTSSSRSSSKSTSSENVDKKTHSGSDKKRKSSSKSREKKIDVKHHHNEESKLNDGSSSKSKSDDSQENMEHSKSLDKEKKSLQTGKSHKKSDSLVNNSKLKKIPVVKESPKSSSYLKREKSTTGKSGSKPEKSNESARSIYLDQMNELFSDKPHQEVKVVNKPAENDKEKIRSHPDSKLKDVKTKDTKISLKDGKKNRDRDKSCSFKPEKISELRKKDKSNVEESKKDKNRKRSHSKESMGHKIDRERKTRRKSEKPSRSESDAKIKLEVVKQDKSKNERSNDKIEPIHASEPKAIKIEQSDMNKVERSPKKRSHENEHHSSVKRRKQCRKSAPPQIVADDERKIRVPPLISDAPDMSAPNSESTSIGTEIPIVTSSQESVGMEAEGAEPHATDFNSDQGYESVTSQSINTPASVGSQQKTPTRDDHEVCTPPTDFPIEKSAKSHDTTCSANLVESPTKMFVDKTCLSFAFSSQADDDPSVMQETSHADLGEFDIATSKADYCEGDQIVAGPLLSGNQPGDDNDLLSGELKACVAETGNMGTFSSQFDDPMIIGDHSDSDFVPLLDCKKEKPDEFDEFVNSYETTYRGDETDRRIDGSYLNTSSDNVNDIDFEEFPQIIGHAGKLLKRLNEMSSKELNDSECSNLKNSSRVKSAHREDSNKSNISEDDLSNENISDYATTSILSLIDCNIFKSENSTHPESSTTTTVPTPAADSIQKETVKDEIPNKDVANPMTPSSNDNQFESSDKKASAPAPHPHPSKTEGELDMEVLFKRKNNKNKVRPPPARKVTQQKSTRSPQNLKPIEIDDKMTMNDDRDNRSGTNNNKTKDMSDLLIISAPDLPRKSRLRGNTDQIGYSLSLDGQKKSPIANNNHNGDDKKRKSIDSQISRIKKRRDSDPKPPPNNVEIDKLFDELKRKPPVNVNFIDNNTPKSRVPAKNDASSFTVESVKKPNDSDRIRTRNVITQLKQGVNGVSGGRNHQRPQSSSYSHNSSYVPPNNRWLTHAEITKLTSTRMVTVPNPKLSVNNGEDHSWRKNLEGVIHNPDLFE